MTSVQNMMSNTIKVAVLLIVSIAIASIVHESNAISFLSILPTILGILLGGVLTCLAIIFGLLSSQELSIIHSKSEDAYYKFLHDVKLDTVIIFYSVSFSIIIFLIYDLDFPFMSYPVFVAEYITKIQLIMGFALFGLLMSLSAIYDIIFSLFYLNQVRYEISKNKNNKSLKEA